MIIILISIMMAIRGSGGMASLLADEKDIVVPLKRNPVL